MFRYANSKIDKNDTLALHLAIEMGHLKTSIVLIEHGINVNGEVNNKTPLHTAVQSHFAEIIPTMVPELMLCVCLTQFCSLESIHLYTWLLGLDTERP